MCAAVAGLNQGTRRRQDPILVGSSNEAEVKINGATTTALIDTGSCISSISKSFYDKHLNNVKIEPLQEILNVECADGGELPYIGFIPATLSTVGIENSQDQECLFLITPGTNYTEQIPVLLGTNILNELV